MTEPQQPSQQPPQTGAAAAGSAGSGSTDAAVVAALVVLLLLPHPETPSITRWLLKAGVSRVAAEAATGLVLGGPIPPTGPIGEATRLTQRENAMRRAQYLLNAARRLTAAISAKGLGAALVAERRYFNSHQEAGSKRTMAAAAVDSAAWQHGPVLGWYAVHDSRTDQHCLEADGKNFYANRRPRIGWPGADHHINCRCTAGRPHRTRKMVDGGLLPKLPDTRPGFVQAN